MYYYRLVNYVNIVLHKYIKILLLIVRSYEFSTIYQFSYTFWSITRKR